MIVSFQPVASMLRLTRLLQRRDWGTRLLAVLPAGIVLYCLWLIVGWGGPENRALISNLAYLPLNLVPVLLCWRPGLLTRLDGRSRLAWVLIGAGQASDLLANLIWAYLENYLGVQPYPSVADIFYLGFYVLTLLGILLFPWRNSSRAASLAMWLDVLTVVIGGGMLLWYFVLRSAALEAGSDSLSTFVGVAYPIGSLALIFGAAILSVKRPSRAGLNSLIFIGAGAVVRFIGDIIYAFQIFDGSYQSGNWSDLFWFVAFLCVALGATIDYHDAAQGAAPQAVIRAARPIDPLPYLAVASGYAMVLAIGWNQLGTPFGDIIIGALILTMLVLARQIITVRQNMRLLDAQATQRGEARLRALVREASDLIMVVDQQGLLQYTTPAVEPALGYSSNALIGRNLFELIHPDDAAQLHSLLAQAMQQPQATAPAVWRARHYTGEWLELETIGRDLRSHADVGGIVLTSRSTNERKAREQAETASMAKSMFLAQMSHELRTPLTVIIGYTELLQLQMPVTQSMALSVDLAKIKISAQHLLGLINDVLDFSKVEAGKLSIRPQRLDMRDLLDDLRNTIEPMVAQNGNILQITYADDLMPLVADPLRIRQILLNLLSNAAKFTEQGTITLDARIGIGPASLTEGAAEPGDWLRFTVTDTGIGIDPEGLAQLFEPFTQLGNPIGRPAGGTGLGLALSQKLCRLMGGDIQIVSQVGQGTVATVWLPRQPAGALLLDDEDGADDATPALAASLAPLPFMPTVLAMAVTSDPALRNAIERVLPSARLAVVTADDGEDGVQLAQELAPNVLLIDARTPDPACWQRLAELAAEAPLDPGTLLLLIPTQLQPLVAVLDAAGQLLQQLRPAHAPAYEQPTLLVFEQQRGLAATLRRLTDGLGWQIIEIQRERPLLGGLAGEQPGIVAIDLAAPDLDQLDLFVQLQRSAGAVGMPVLLLAGEEALDAAPVLQHLQRLLEQVVIE